MTDPIRVLLVDDQALIRIGFRLVLDADPSIEVVGEAGDGADAIVQTAALNPDVVLMDVRMPGMDGIAATEQIVREHPQVRVLVLTTFDLDEYAFGAIRAGASGFLLKDAQRQELISAVGAVHRGDGAMAPRATRALLDHLAAEPASAVPAFRGSGEAVVDPLADLTERERDVFRTIAQGLSNSEIAAALYLSESTVKTHVGRVLAKLGARDRVHLVILAYQWGLADPA